MTEDNVAAQVWVSDRSDDLFLFLDASLKWDPIMLAEELRYRMATWGIRSGITNIHAFKVNLARDPNKWPRLVGFDESGEYVELTKANLTDTEPSFSGKHGSVFLILGATWRKRDEYRKWHDLVGGGAEYDIRRDSPKGSLPRIHIDVRPYRCMDQMRIAAADQGGREYRRRSRIVSVLKNHPNAKIRHGFITKD